LTGIRCKLHDQRGTNRDRREARLRLRSPRAVEGAPTSLLGSRPDRRQPDAVLATVKAWAGNGRACGMSVATPSVDSGCARRHGVGAGRDGETVQVKQRN
jgi:hypothetical protein